MKELFSIYETFKESIGGEFLFKDLSNKVEGVKIDVSNITQFVQKNENEILNSVRVLPSIKTNIPTLDKFNPISFHINTKPCKVCGTQISRFLPTSICSEGCISSYIKERLLGGSMGFTEHSMSMFASIKEHWSSVEKSIEEIELVKKQYVQSLDDLYKPIARFYNDNINKLQNLNKTGEVFIHKHTNKVKDLMNKLYEVASKSIEVLLKKVNRVLEYISVMLSQWVNNVMSYCKTDVSLFRGFKSLDIGISNVSTKVDLINKQLELFNIAYNKIYTVVEKVLSLFSIPAQSLNLLITPKSFIYKGANVMNKIESNKGAGGRGLDIVDQKLLNNLLDKFPRIKEVDRFKSPATFNGLFKASRSNVELVKEAVRVANLLPFGLKNGEEPIPPWEELSLFNLRFSTWSFLNWGTSASKHFGLPF